MTAPLTTGAGGRPAEQPGDRLRVAMVSFDHADVCVAQVNALASLVEVHLVVADDLARDVAGLVSPAVTLVAFDKARLRQPVRQWRACRDLDGVLAAIDPSVIHVQQGHLWVNLLALPRWRRRTVVVSVHDPSPHVGDLPSRKTPQVVTELGFRRADRLVAHSRWVRGRLEQALAHRCPPVDVVPLPTVLPLVPPAAAPARPGRRILFFGRIWAYKGLEHLVAAEPLVTAAVPDVEIVIAGQGEELDRYRRSMVHPERFTVLEGHVPRERVPAVFGAADVVALPYVDATQSAVIPLASVFAKPVVASTAGGLPEMVDHGVTGLLVPPGDHVALAGALVDLLCHGSRRQAMGAAAQRKAREEWAPELVAHQLVGVYRRALRRTGSRR